MSIGNRFTAQLNTIEEFAKTSPLYMFPLKLLAWAFLFVALIVTNWLAILRWPFSVLAKQLGKDQGVAGEPINISSKEELSEIIASEKTVLLDFWAQWCGPCLMMNQSIADIAKENSENLVVVKVDVSLGSDLSELHGVRGLPTVIAFKNGSEVMRKSGSLTKLQLSQMLLEVTNKAVGSS